MPDIWSLVAQTYPGVRLESAIQGWAFLERFEEGLKAYAEIPDPSPKDDRWAAVCHFQLLQDNEALRLLYRAAERGEAGAHVFLAHVLPFVDRGEEASSELAKANVSQLSEYDQALYYRVSSIREETNGNLREALRAAEEAWKRIQGVPEYAILAPSILAQLAVLHGRIGRSQRALWFLERGMVATTGTELLKVQVRRAAVLVNLGRYREAEAELESRELVNAPPQFQPERLWLLGEIAWSKGNTQNATERYEEAIGIAQGLQFSYEEFLCRLPLMCILALRQQYSAAQDHLTRAQLLISDKSDRLLFRFREVLLHYWMGRYQPSHALLELDGLLTAFTEMGLLQEQAAVRLHRAEIMRQSAAGGWSKELDELQALSISLQNPALLAREWTLVPDLHSIAQTTHPRIAGQAPTTLNIYTLGEERICLNDKEVSIPLRRSPELLAYFLHHKAVALKQLLSDVFPEEKLSAAKSYFHQFRHQLREQLDGVEIEYDPESKMYRLKSEVDIVWDVNELRAGRRIGSKGAFLPSSTNTWARDLDEYLEPYRGSRVAQA